MTRGVVVAQLYYMSLPNVGPWPRALADSGPQLRPFRQYLNTAREAALRRPPIVAWEPATPAQSQRFDARLRQRFEQAARRAATGARRRDRHSPAAVAAGTWVRLLPPPWNPEAPDSTFEAFLDRRAEIHDRPPRPKERGARVLEFDREGCAILLANAPDPIDPDDDGSDYDAQYVGRLLFLGANTYTLERQIKALDTLESRPPPRLAPLVALAVSNGRWDAFEPRSVADDDWIFLNNPDRNGTDEQRGFVRMALGTPDFAILEGPPGSGKTTAICELIAQLTRARKRVMLVASTHVAVDNVLERLLEKQEGSTEKFVLPVRIGDEENVASDLVKPWVYQRLKQTWRDDIQDFLDDPGAGSPYGGPARAALRASLASTEKPDDSPLIRLLLESANLVCGTTIGILQHPAIKAARDQGFEPFDVLIVDEASKTPFAEFLVPAVHARRWVIVGDVRQLSPYVEDADLTENIRGLIPPDVADAAAWPFVASKRRYALVVSKGTEMSSRLAAEADARDVRFVDLDQHDPSTPVFDLLHAELVFGSTTAIQAFEHRLPPDLVVTGGDLPDLPGWEASRSALAASKHRVNPEEDPVDWASEVSWRLIRSYELRQNAEERAGLMKDIEALFPTQLSPEGRARLMDTLDTVRRVAMPSVLEILQRGFERLPDKPLFKVALTDGLPQGVLRPRLVSLSYQHRMHPDISAFPREKFYTERGHTEDHMAVLRSLGVDPDIGEIDVPEAPVLLRDAADMAARREWTNTRYRGGRAVWMNVHPDNGRARGNRNTAEARRVIAELDAFVDWASTNMRQDEAGKPIPWEVGVLTFYKGQEAILRDALQHASGLPGNNRNFQLPGDVPFDRRPVHATLCTVDRFQGHEADLVLLSFVKSGTVGFLNSPNRLNVALTRARYQLVLVGDREFFRSKRCKSPLLQDLAESEHYPADLTWESKP